MIEPVIDLRVTNEQKFFFGFRPYAETWSWKPLNFWLYSLEDKAIHERKLFAARDWMRKNEIKNKCNTNNQ